MMDYALYNRYKLSGYKDGLSRRSLQVKLNGRSADFIIPSFAVGCGQSCVYCYVNRHRPFGNPLYKYGNHSEIKATILQHYQSLRLPKSPNQTDDVYYTYDIGMSNSL